MDRFQRFAFGWVEMLSSMPAIGRVLSGTHLRDLLRDQFCSWFSVMLNTRILNQSQEP